MTGPGPGSGPAERSGRPDRAGQRARSGDPDHHAEEVLEQALRALAGGGRPGRSQPAEAGRPPTIPFTRLQVVLLAVLLGLLIGMTAGVISLLT